VIVYVSAGSDPKHYIPLVRQIFPLVANIYEVNSSWSELTYLTMGPSELSELLYKMVISPWENPANCTRLSSKPEDVGTTFRATTATAIHLLNLKVPERWRVSYGFYFHLGDNDYSFATNWKFPLGTTRALVMSSANPPEHCQIKRYSDLSMWFRHGFIKEKAPFIYHAEYEFKNASKSE
jgi:hypothetical protein